MSLLLVLFTVYYSSEFALSLPLVSFRLGLSLNVFWGNPDFLAEIGVYFFASPDQLQEASPELYSVYREHFGIDPILRRQNELGNILRYREDLVRLVLPQGQRIVSAEHYLPSVAWYMWWVVLKTGDLVSAHRMSETRTKLATLIRFWKLLDCTVSDLLYRKYRLTLELFKSVQFK